MSYISRENLNQIRLNVASTQKLNTNLNKLFFYMNIKFDELLSETDNALQKEEFNLTTSA